MLWVTNGRDLFITHYLISIQSPANDLFGKQISNIKDDILPIYYFRDNPTMAVVLDSLASYIQNMLTELVKEEVHMLLGVPCAINNMAVKLADLKKFLADADRRNITDESVQAWIKALRGTVYDALTSLNCASSTPWTRVQDGIWVASTLCSFAWETSSMPTTLAFV